MPETDRQTLRKSILAARDALEPQERRLKSDSITRKLWRIETVCQAKTLFAYVSFRSEVQTLPFIRQCLGQGKVVAAPLTVAAENRLVPYALADPALDLRPGYCGIPEPDTTRLAPVDPGQIDVVIVPGSVFDPAGGRLGYGGGYYDRFLAKEAPQACRIGIAFEIQVVTAVPLLPHDQRLHILVTEKRIITVPAAP